MKTLHPQSRKAAQEKKHFHHVQRVVKRQKQRDIRTRIMISKLSWFRDHLPNDCRSMNQNDINKLISRYLQRAGGDVSTKSGPVSVSTDMNNLYIQQESQEYITCGIEIPDLSSKLNLENLR
ncbi:unnamed protein product [Heterobilharzia americana]|nr:unnamed protein product [Heterobilharzia americana]CAH8651343.1 unnamed protein product [Heterobilharzia americana]